MNKAELVAKIAEKSNLTKKESELALNAFINMYYQLKGRGGEYI